MMEIKDENILLNRYLYNCNKAISNDMERAKKWFDKAYRINPNDKRVMWLKDNFYPRTTVTAFTDGAYYWEGCILEKQEHFC